MAMETRVLFSSLLSQTLIFETVFNYVLFCFYGSVLQLKFKVKLQTSRHLCSSFFKILKPTGQISARQLQYRQCHASVGVFFLSQLLQRNAFSVQLFYDVFIKLDLGLSLLALVSSQLGWLFTLVIFGYYVVF